MASVVRTDVNDGDDEPEVRINENSEEQEQTTELLTVTSETATVDPENAADIPQDCFQGDTEPASAENAFGAECPVSAAAATPSGSSSPVPQDSLKDLNATAEMSLVPDPAAQSQATPLPSHVEVKLFVGRVPRSYEAEHLKPLFEQFGPVLEVAVLKDKTTLAHKGSAFVRMESLAHADAAIRALNHVKVLEPSLGALQVRYAIGEAEKFGFSADNGTPGHDQVKLFVGSLPRTITEEQVYELFQPFGVIDEVFLLKDSTTGSNKGCAFVKFAFKESALAAIRVLNGNQTVNGGSRPIEVRVAETKKQAAAGTALGVPPVSAPPSGVPHQVQRPPAPSGVPMAGMVVPVGGPVAPNMTAVVAAASNANPRQVGGWKEYFSQEGRAYYHNPITNMTQWERPPEFDGANLFAPPRPGGEITGPPGANIFVFHIPNDWTQNDLCENFGGFGNIISARIATDKATNRNKGYAFVSYDNIHSAVQAVLNMNGFMACGKRLKVSIKQNEDKYVSHLLPQGQSPGGSTPSSTGAPCTPMGSNLAMVGNMHMSSTPMMNPAMYSGGHHPAFMGMMGQSGLVSGQGFVPSGSPQMGSPGVPSGGVPQVSGQTPYMPYGPLPSGQPNNQRYGPY